jgi:hypothetical protein
VCQINSSNKLAHALLVVFAAPCEGWLGVECNGTSGDVTGLHLTILNITTPSLSVLDLISSIANLTHLEVLVLSGLGLSGPLDDPTSPNLGLHMFRRLRHLDVSNNPTISGTLPVGWFALKSLQTLDVSGCNISGTLPTLYMALQELKVFKAVNCSGITGRLPPEFGLLNLETLQLTNTALTGTLPSEWANLAALRRIAAASLKDLNGTSGVISSNVHVARASSNIVLQPQRTVIRSVATKLRASAASSALMGLQHLRVLDLSVAGSNRGKLAGTLPGSFAAIKRLEVNRVMLSAHPFCVIAASVYRTCNLHAPLK